MIHDALVGLVWHQQADLTGSQAIALQQQAGGGFHAFAGLDEHILAVGHHQPLGTRP